MRISRAMALKPGSRKRSQTVPEQFQCARHREFFSANLKSPSGVRYNPSVSPQIQRRTGPTQHDIRFCTVPSIKTFVRTPLSELRLYLIVLLYSRILRPKVVGPTLKHGNGLLSTSNRLQFASRDPLSSSVAFDDPSSVGFGTTHGSSICPFKDESGSNSPKHDTTLFGGVERGGLPKATR